METGNEAIMADRAKELVEFLAKYQWTWEIKLTRFFVEKHWEKIPKEVYFPIQTSFLRTCVNSMFVY